MKLTNLVILLTFLVVYSGNLAQHSGLNRVLMDTSMVHEGFDMLDSVVGQKRIVFTGEDHTYNVSNNVLKFKLITYLYEQGFRYFVIEFGHGIGYLANQYVTTGDEEVWRILNAGKPANEPNYLSELLQPLKEFNSGKDPEDQVKIIGADLTRYPIFSLRAMALIIQQSKCEEELAKFYEDITVVASARPNIDRLGFAGRLDDLETFDIQEGFKSYRNRLFELSVRNLLQDFYSDTLQFSLSLGDKYEDFKFLADEIQTTLDWYKRDNVIIQSHIDRERHLEKRILQIFEADTLAKVAGQFGRCHIRNNAFMQNCYSFDLASVTARLGKHDFLKEKVLILPIFYQFYEAEFSVNRAQSPYKMKELFEEDAMYLYDTELDWIDFHKDMEIPRFVLLNTFSPYISVDGLQSSSDLSKVKRYRGRMEEDHYALTYRRRNFSNAVNQDFGQLLLPEVHEFYGTQVVTSSEDGMRGIFGISFIRPTHFNSDSLNLRYTNWNIFSGAGYNWVYNSWLSVYSDLLFEFGFAKIREDRGFLDSEFTYDFEKNRVNYRNPYMTILPTSGVQLKMKFFSIFAEVGYSLDYTKAEWRNRGILEQSTPTRFSGLWLSGGFTFYYRGKPYVSNYFL